MSVQYFNNKHVHYTRYKSLICIMDHFSTGLFLDKSIDSPVKRNSPITLIENDKELNFV